MGRQLLTWLMTLCLAGGMDSSGVAAEGTLFPTDLAGNQWVEFAAAGFSAPVSGVIFRPDQPTCCGVPLGGVGTGCLDIQVGGVLGFETLFNAFPRRPQLLTPFLGVSVGGKTHVLAAQKYIDGGELSEALPWPACSRDSAAHLPTTLVKIEGVTAPKRMQYFGHYPMVDIEYELDGPLGVGLRAFSPFLPGDVEASNIPAAIFEVHLRNTSSAEQAGTLAFSFPGIPPIAVLHEGKHAYTREALSDPVRGAAVGGPSAIGYVLGVIGDEKVRSGAQLSSDGAAWARIANELPKTSPEDSGASVAVDFVLPAGGSRAVRFLLAWYSPTFIGDKDNRYTNFYATRYQSAVDVARRMVKEHPSLLRRILAWQEVVYTDEALPVWLRDTLVNTLSIITEVSYWAAPKGPLADWCSPDGYFAMNESPRTCSHIGCIPCTYFANMPINYFYPELARTTLRAHKYHQRKDGAVPVDLGPLHQIGLMTPSYEVQKVLNSFCFVALVDRLWMRTGDKTVLDEFYPAVKKAATYTVEMCSGPDAVISFPDGTNWWEKTDWWEKFPWYGMGTHAGGLRISGMYIAERMAKAVGDEAFAAQCRKWQEQGKHSMETKMWNEKAKSYLLYHDPKSGKTNDVILANQLDGEWSNRFHGLPGLFRRDRVESVLATIKQSCLCSYGSVAFARADKTPLVTAYIMIAPMMMVGYTYMYEQDYQTGMQILHNCMHNLVIKHRVPWDLPCMVSMPASTSKKTKTEDGVAAYSEGTGTGHPCRADYNFGLMLWSTPAVLAGTDLAGPCKPGGLVYRIIDAARSERE